MIDQVVQNRFVLGIALILWLHHGLAWSQIKPSDLPAGATVATELSDDNVTAYYRGNTLWLALHPSALKAGLVQVPRLFAPIRTMSWKGLPDQSPAFSPGTSKWTFSWSDAPPKSIIELTLDRPISQLTEAPVVLPAADGSLMLHAHEATPTGTSLRYEPQPNKNTIGYWTNPSDSVTWEFMIEAPGTYAIAILQGCGAGQGGSTATVSLSQEASVVAERTFETVDTGHFQNFRWYQIGLVDIGLRGKHQLRIHPDRIAKAALFDVRAVHLIRQAQPVE